MLGQLYRGYANATALSSSPVVSALGSESDNPGSSPSRGKALCPRDVRKKKKKKKEKKKKGKYPESQWERAIKIIKLPKARENADDQAIIGYSSASNWLREWRKFSGPIIEQSKAQTQQSRITLDTQSKFLHTIWLPRNSHNMLKFTNFPRNI